MPVSKSTSSQHRRRKMLHFDVHPLICYLHSFVCSLRWPMCATDQFDEIANSCKTHNVETLLKLFGVCQIVWKHFLNCFDVKRERERTKEADIRKCLKRSHCIEIETNVTFWFILNLCDCYLLGCSVLFLFCLVSLVPFCSFAFHTLRTSNAVHFYSEHVKFTINMMIEQS